MRLKRVKDADEIVMNNDYVVNTPQMYLCKWNEVFNNTNPIEIEIGTGKGNFIINKALNNPNINYIGIEKYSSALVYAIKKLNNVNISNLKLIWLDAENIEEVFNHEVSKIYLTFSDPWPKKRHTKRRLTSPYYLKKYDSLFINKKIIEQKTDNDEFFEYSINSFEEYGYEIISIDSNFDDIFKTEYEIKFSNLGKNINHVIVKK